MRVQHAVAAVSALAGKSQLRAGAIKSRAPVDELFDCGRAFLDQRAHSFGIAEAIAGKQGVLLVKLDFVVVAERNRNAPLRILGGGFAQAAFRDNKHFTGGGEFDGRAKPRNAGSYDDEIGADAVWRGDDFMLQRDHMPAFEVRTASGTYSAIVERGALRRIGALIPPRAGKVFVLTTEDVWRLHGEAAEELGERVQVLFFPGGEVNKRLTVLERLAEQMIAAGADRTSVLVALGGGIVNDVGGFLAAIFMRGIPVIQVPTTLLAQVDAAVGGKTGVNLACGKNLIGSFHQPLAVLIDPNVLRTLPAREYRAGLFEVIKCGVIRDRKLFDLLDRQTDEVLAMKPDAVNELIAAAVGIKAEVVSADERESNLRRILNFGHTVGHAIEAETEYVRFLHGEAVAWGMLAVTRLAELLGKAPAEDAERIRRVICRYGPLPPAGDLDPDRLIARFASDKKTLQGNVHFVLPTRIGEVEIVSGIDAQPIRRALAETLRDAR